MGNGYTVPSPEGLGDGAGTGQRPDPAPGTARSEEGSGGSDPLGWESFIQRETPHPDPVGWSLCMTPAGMDRDGWGWTGMDGDGQGWMGMNGRSSAGSGTDTSSPQIS